MPIAGRTEQGEATDFPTRNYTNHHDATSYKTNIIGRCAHPRTESFHYLSTLCVLVQCSITIVVLESLLPTHKHSVNFGSTPSTTIALVLRGSLVPIFNPLR